MATYGVYRVTEKKCATCSYWDGKRTIDFIAYKPKYIKADARHANCIAQKNRETTAGTTCLKWNTWEKID